MKQKASLIVVASLVLGLVFNWLFYGHQPGISVFLYSALIIFITLYFTVRFRATLQLFSLLVVVGSTLFFSIMVAVRASAPLIFLDIVASLYMLLVMARLLMQTPKQLSSFTLTEYANLVWLPLSFIGQLPLFGSRLLSTKNEMSSNRRAVTPIVRGIVISLPILALFLVLLSSADLVFKKYVASLFTIRLNPQSLSHIALILVVASMFVGAYGLIFLHSRTQEPEINKQRRITLGTVESSIILGSVSLLFLVFVLIQLTYLFGGHGHVVATGITYAEYARHGFFELIMVAAVSLALIWVLSKDTIRRSSREIRIFICLSGALTLEVMVIMLSAVKRLALYEDAYGFTELRLYSHVFIGWLAVLFVLLLVHLIRQEREQQFAFRVFLSAIAFLALLNFLNPEALIAHQNIQRFTRTGKLDVDYLTSLTDDATPEISGLLNNKSRVVSQTVAHDLYYKKQSIENQARSWQSFNISRNRSIKVLHKNSDQLKLSKDYITPLSSVDSSHN